MADISHGAHSDNVNQQFSIIGVQGTLGTADVSGTAKTLPIGVDPSTGGVYSRVTGSAGLTADVTDHGGSGALNVHTPDMTMSGNLTALNSTVEIELHGMGSCVVQVSGTWTGKIEFQGAIDGVWNTLSIFQPTGAITRNGIQNDNQNGLYRVVITSGYTKARAIMTTYTSGTAAILFNASTPVGSNQVWQLNPANLNATVTGTVAVSALPTVYNGTKTCPTVTSEAIDGTQAISSVTIKALSTNTGIVYVGNSTVTTANGFELLAGESVSLDCDNLNDVYVIGSGASQVVRYIAV